MYSSYQIYYFYVHIDLLMDCSFYMDTYGVIKNIKISVRFAVGINLLEGGVIGVVVASG